MQDPGLEDVRKVYEALIEAWNHRDAGGMARLFASQGVQIGFDGSTAIGPADILQHLDPIFKDHPTARYVTKIKSVRLLGSGTALLTAIAGMVPPGTDDIAPQINAHQTVVATVENGAWMIELFQNTPAQFHGRPELVDAMTEELRELLPKR
jgi:uncharacterized protein (TIGR02246 family)